MRPVSAICLALVFVTFIVAATYESHQRKASEAAAGSTCVQSGGQWVTSWGRYECVREAQ